MFLIVVDFVSCFFQGRTRSTGGGSPAKKTSKTPARHTTPRKKSKTPSRKGKSPAKRGRSRSVSKSRFSPQKSTRKVSKLIKKTSCLFDWFSLRLASLQDVNRCRSLRLSSRTLQNVAVLVHIHRQAKSVLVALRPSLKRLKMLLK